MMKTNCDASDKKMLGNCPLTFSSRERKKACELVRWENEAMGLYLLPLKVTEKNTSNIWTFGNIEKDPAMSSLY